MLLPPPASALPLHCPLACVTRPKKKVITYRGASKQSLALHRISLSAAGWLAGWLVAGSAPYLRRHTRPPDGARKMWWNGAAAYGTTAPAATYRRALSCKENKAPDWVDLGAPCRRSGFPQWTLAAGSALLFHRVRAWFTTTSIGWWGWVSYAALCGLASARSTRAPRQGLSRLVLRVLGLRGMACGAGGC